MSLQIVSPTGGIQPLLRADGVSLEYGGTRATHDVSFDVYRGDRFVLLGPSGCGKSSLLKAAAGFISRRRQHRINGAEVRGPGPDRIVVFQEFDQLPPWKTVGERDVPAADDQRVSRHEAPSGPCTGSARWAERI
jgi:NitT/TauT family transport system ATP-binding protein